MSNWYIDKLNFKIIGDILYIEDFVLKFRISYNNKIIVVIYDFLKGKQNWITDTRGNWKRL